MADFTPMLSKFIAKVRGMRPIPPTDDLFSDTWNKVDKLILKTMRAMKERGEERPLHPLCDTFMDMALDDAARNWPNTDVALQTVAYRVLDTRLLVDEFGRMRKIAVGIRDQADNVPPHFPPEHDVCIPPCFTREVYNDSAVGIVEAFAAELRRRGVLSQQKA